MSAKTKSGIVITTFLLVFVMFSVLPMPSMAQTSGNDVKVEYSFNEVKSSYLKAGVYKFDDNSLIQTISTNSYRGSHGSFKFFAGLPFNADPLGNAITQDQAVSKSMLVAEKKIGNTLVQYREFYYAMDILIYSDVLLPESFTTDTVQMPGWTSADDKDPNNGWAVTNGANYLLVLEETAPAGSYNSATVSSGLYYRWPFDAGRYAANSVGFSPIGKDWVGTQYATNFMEGYQTFQYSAKSINLKSITDKVGGNRPLVVRPEISITAKPWTTRMINLDTTSVATYTAIMQVKCVKNVGGIVKDTYSAYSPQFSSVMKDNIPPITIQGDSRQATTPSTLSGSSGSGRGAENADDPNRAIAYTATCVVDPDPVKWYKPSRQEGVQVGVPLPMYYTSTDTLLPNITSTSSIALIDGAPETVKIIPEMVIQPNWNLTNRTVNADGLYVSYRDPWKDWTGNRVYEDTADAVTHLPSSIDVLTDVEIENIYVVNRLLITVLVASAADVVPVLTSGGTPITNATLGGRNTLGITDPRNSSASASTPAPVLTFWESLAAGWGEFWSGLGLGENGGTVMIVVVIIAVVIVLVVCSMMKGGTSIKNFSPPGKPAAAPANDGGSGSRSGGSACPVGKGETFRRSQKPSRADKYRSARKA